MLSQVWADTYTWAGGCSVGENDMENSQSTSQMRMQVWADTYTWVGGCSVGEYDMEN
jgi:hypothetical protein